MAGLIAAGCAENGDGSKPRLLLTSSDAPSALQAAIGVTLITDDGGCVQGESATGNGRSIAWPLGYQVRGGAEEFEILDADGDVVAASGTVVQMGGGTIDDVGDGWTNEDCAVTVPWLVGDIAD